MKLDSTLGSNHGSTTVRGPSARRLLPALAAAAVLAAAAALSGCGFLPVVSGSGTMARSVFPVPDSSAIQASHAFQVRVVPDTVFSVTVTCDDNLLPYLVVQREGTGCLRLGLVQGYNYVGVTLSAEVHMPGIRTIDASGGSTVRLDPGFSSADPLTVVLSGASTCDAPSVHAGSALLDLSGGSTVSLAGSAAGLSITASGASRARLLDCAAPGARVNLSGASEAWIDVGTGAASVSASGASTLYHGGYPAFTLRDLSGGSRIVKVR